MNKAPPIDGLLIIGASGKLDIGARYTNRSRPGWDWSADSRNWVTGTADWGIRREIGQVKLSHSPPALNPKNSVCWGSKSTSPSHLTMKSVILSRFLQREWEFQVGCIIVSFFLKPFITDHRLESILIISLSTTARSHDPPAFCTLYPGWTFSGHWKMETLTRIIHHVALRWPTFAMLSTYIGCVYSVYCIYIYIYVCVYIYMYVYIYICIVIIFQMFARCHNWRYCCTYIIAALDLWGPLCTVNLMCHWDALCSGGRAKSSCGFWWHQRTGYDQSPLLADIMRMHEVSWSTLLSLRRAMLFFQFLGWVLGVQHETAGKAEVASQVVGA